MASLILLMLGLLAGAVLGALFFGGLWWTSRRLLSGASSSGFLALSFVGRMVVLALGLIVLARMHPLLLVGAVPGLVAARVGWTRSVGPDTTASSAAARQEA